MNLDVTSDDSCLDPHVSCVKTSHPAAQLNVHPEEQSVRQSMMSGPHRGDGAHRVPLVLWSPVGSLPNGHLDRTTFGTSRKFIRGVADQVPSQSLDGNTHPAPLGIGCRAQRLRLRSRK